MSKSTIDECIRHAEAYFGCEDENDCPTCLEIIRILRAVKQAQEEEPRPKMVYLVQPGNKCIKRCDGCVA